MRRRTALTSEPDDHRPGRSDAVLQLRAVPAHVGAELDDDPARPGCPTLPAAGFDITKLGTAAAAEAECEKVASAALRQGGRDPVRRDQLASGTIAHVEEPLEAEIDALTADKTTLTKENESLKATVFQTSPLQSQVDALTQQLVAANAQVAALTAKAAPMLLTLADVSASGAQANVTGAGQQGHRPAAHHRRRPRPPGSGCARSCSPPSRRPPPRTAPPALRSS